MYVQLSCAFLFNWAVAPAGEAAQVLAAVSMDPLFGVCVSFVCILLNSPEQPCIVRMTGDAYVQSCVMLEFMPYQSLHQSPAIPIAPLRFYAAFTSLCIPVCSASYVDTSGGTCLWCKKCTCSSCREVYKQEGKLQQSAC